MDGNCTDPNKRVKRKNGIFHISFSIFYLFISDCRENDDGALLFFPLKSSLAA
jgi:hypothetical protein